jgi:hypothetical protein
MGANAQTEVPAFTAGQILTAAEMTQVNTGIPVFATTVTRDAAFGGAGEKVLAQGQYAYIEATSSLMVYSGSAWIAAGQTPGLVFIKSQTIGSAVTTVTVTGAFSSTYDNYLINVSGGVGTADTALALRLGSTSTGYYSGSQRVSWSGTGSTDWDNNAPSWAQAGRVSGNYLSMNCNLFSPNLADQTTFSSTLIQASTGGFGANTNGFLNDTTQYTDFTLIPSTGTITGGTIRVYGYANS